jgi:phenylpropionate dioxygenase-like ring-hydroxylating dioxygenase large terminal subunit
VEGLHADRRSPGKTDQSGPGDSDGRTDAPLLDTSVRPLAQLQEEDVMSIRILGEDLVLFITKKGELGLVGERCPHRAVLMKYGIPDEDGLRCCYHGWNFAPDGQCIDMPLEAPTNKLKDQVKIAAYPVQEMGGLVGLHGSPASAITGALGLIRHAQRHPADRNLPPEVQLAPVPREHRRPGA